MAQPFFLRRPRGDSRPRLSGRAQRGCQETRVFLRRSMRRRGTRPERHALGKVCGWGGDAVEEARGWEGHDFSRANRSRKSSRALAPGVLLFAQKHAELGIAPTIGKSKLQRLKPH